jgi:hypothetical protein
MMAEVTMAETYSLFSLLKPKTYLMYHQLQQREILCSAHNEFMCFVWISEQAALFLFTALTYRFL